MMTVAALVSPYSGAEALGSAGEGTVRVAGFCLCSQKSRASWLVLELCPGHTARNVCPLLHGIVMRDGEITGQISVNA